MDGSSAVLKGIQKYSDISSSISGITTSWDTFGLCFQDIYGKTLKSGNDIVVSSGYIDNSQLVYSVGHLNEIEKSILDMEIKIKTEVTIDTTIKDELETDEELEV